MAADSKRDRTAFFQALERELEIGGVASCETGTALSQAENALKPFFEHQDRLKRALGVGSLTYEAFFLRAKLSEAWVPEIVGSVLSEARAARTANKVLCLQTWAEWMQVTNRAIANVAATAMLQTYKDTLEPALMVRSCLRESGDILEGSLQPFIRLRLKMLDICGRRKHKGKHVERLTFGEVVDEVVNNTNDTHIYAPPPFNVAVNQWRNIANHNSYEVVGNVVCCTYGQHSNLKQFQCTPNDIFNIACYFNDLCFAHKVAIEIFGIDNMQEMTQWISNIELSDYTKNAALAFGLRDHGFSVRLALQEPDKWKLIVVDRHNRDSKAVKAALHEACVAYALMNGTAHLEFSVHSAKGTARVGFKVSCQKEGEALPPDFRGTTRKLDQNFRLLDGSGA